MRAPLLVTLSIVTVTAVACSSSGNAGSPPASPAGSTPAATTPAATTPAATTAASSTPSSSTPASGSGITLSGAFTGKITATLCTSNIASIAVALDGDSETYRGSISATSFGFVGPDAADYTLAAGQPKPSVSGGGQTFAVDSVTLVDLVSGKKMIATGSVTCP